MSYYWFYRQELLQKAKKEYENGGKEKNAKYYQANNYVIKESTNSKYNNLTKKEKQAKKEYSKNRYKKIKENARENTKLFLQYKDE